jgi:hypothetical protein
MKIICFILTLLTVGCSSPPLYDDARKLNQIELGMDSQKVRLQLGEPRYSVPNDLGFRCAEYTLLKHSANFRDGTATTFFVMFYGGKVIDLGETSCSSAMYSPNFRDHGSYPGKYAKFFKK